MKQRLIVLALFLAATSGLAFAERIIYVDANATGENNGSSWGDAYKFLQDALEDANSSAKPVEIRVAQGIYRPDETSADPNGTGDREATFQLINGVALKGGYAGFGQTDPNARNIDAYKAILSGDLKGDDNGYYNRGENSYHVVTGSGNDANAVLDGFIITAGNADGAWRNIGAGMYNKYGNPTVLNCIFISNIADYDPYSDTDGVGGGMYNYYSNPMVSNCTFSTNFVGASGAGMDNYYSSPRVVNCVFLGNSASEYGGGGMANNTNSSPTVEDCTFSRNSADYGGGMDNYDHSSPKVINCTFSSNSANEYGGGGMCNYESTPTVTNCTFNSNSANDYGGGMWNCHFSSPTVTNCIFSGNSAQNGGGICNYSYSSPILTNCVFRGNCSNNDGGGMCNYYSNLKVSNCTFSGNSAKNNGGGMYNYDSGPKVNNCTIADNNAANGLVMACDSYQHRYPRTITMVNCIIWNKLNWFWNNDNSTITATYSDIQGGWLGEGNINVDPCFANPNNGDYHLKSQAGRWDPNSARWVKDDITSPCIDAGDPASPIMYEPFPNGGIINMGAYGGTTEASKSYFGEPPCETIVAGDINGDCIVNLKDFALIAFHWLEEH